MTTYLQAPRAWRSEPRRIAIQLRKCINLPGLTVRTRGTLIDITWVDGPAEPPVRRELLGQMPYEHVAVRLERVYSPAAFGAAMLRSDLEGLTGWDRIYPAIRHLDNRDLTTSPFSADEIDSGKALAMLSGVPLDATVQCRGSKRWDYDMVRWLRRGGEAALRAALMTSG